VTPREMEAQKETVHNCFNGLIEKDCENCHAHPSEGGICCYSDPEQYNASDSECRNCVFHDDCESEVVDQLTSDEAYTSNYNRYNYERPRVTTKPRRNVIIKRGTSRASTARTRDSVIRSPTNERLVQIGGRRPKFARGVQEPEVLPPEEDLFQRFLKDFVWGGMQGAFEMGADFFRNHRLP